MTCQYDWKIEWYSVLSKACLNCPLNITSCENKECIAGNGLVRPILTVNRQLPGYILFDISKFFGIFNNYLLRIGPIINVCQGDTIEVRVNNNLRMFEGTSIHW